MRFLFHISRASRIYAPFYIELLFSVFIVRRISCKCVTYFYAAFISHIDQMIICGIFHAKQSNLYQPTLKIWWPDMCSNFYAAARTSSCAPRSQSGKNCSEDMRLKAMQCALCVLNAALCYWVRGKTMHSTRSVGTRMRWRGNENAVTRQRGKPGKRLKFWALSFAVRQLILLSAQGMNAD